LPRFSGKTVRPSATRASIQTPVKPTAYILRNTPAFTR
jgi:hypothetical protein